MVCGMGVPYHEGGSFNDPPDLSHNALVVNVSLTEIARMNTTPTTRADVTAFRLHGSWRRLAKMANAWVTGVSKLTGAPLQPLLGGGTRLMLALDHRISPDIDLVIRDVQWIGYLSPRRNQRVAKRVGDRYVEDATSLKLRFEDGQIDFVVAMSLLGRPPEYSYSEDIDFALEPVAEVLAKMLFYRGSALTPQDLFDWWFVRTQAPELAPIEDVAALLARKLDGIRAGLAALQASALADAQWQRIRAPERPSLGGAIEWARAEVANFEWALHYNRVHAAVDARYDVRGSDLAHLVSTCLDNGNRIPAGKRERYALRVQPEAFDFIEQCAQSLAKTPTMLEALRDPAARFDDDD